MARMRTPDTRIPSLDVLRGIAILGTLATNIWIFTHPEGLIGYIETTWGAQGALGWVEKFLQQVSQGKFLGLLTVMFGIGLAIQRESALRRRWMLLGLGVALPLDFVLGLGGGQAGWVLARYGTAPLAAIGLLALVAEVYVRRPRPGTLGRRMAEIGRIALSGYVLQNILASAICYGWGLGLAARLSASARVPVTIALFLLVSGLVALFAHLWLRRFARGPLEWLWHAGYRRLAGLPAG